MEHRKIFIEQNYLLLQVQLLLHNKNITRINEAKRRYITYTLHPIICHKCVNKENIIINELVTDKNKS